LNGSSPTGQPTCWISERGEERSPARSQAVTGIVAPYATDGMLDMEVVADLAWGRIVAS
jgi:hypothetical protein